MPSEAAAFASIRQGYPLIATLASCGALEFVRMLLSVAQQVPTGGVPTGGVRPKYNASEARCDAYPIRRRR